MLKYGVNSVYIHAKTTKTSTTCKELSLWHW